MTVSEFDPKRIIGSAGQLQELHGIVVEGKPVPLSPSEQKQVERERQLLAQYVESSTEYVGFVFFILTMPQMAKVILKYNEYPYSRKAIIVQSVNYKDDSIGLVEEEVGHYDIRYHESVLKQNQLIRPAIFAKFVNGVSQLCYKTMNGLHNDALKTNIDKFYGEKKIVEVIEALQQANGILKDVFETPDQAESPGK